MPDQDQLPPALAAILAGGTLMGPPRLDVRIARPELKPWLGGNLLPGVWSFTATAPGPQKRSEEDHRLGRADAGDRSPWSSRRPNPAPSAP